MLTCYIEGCNYATESDRALTSHVNNCKKAKTRLAEIAEEVKQYEIDCREAKRRRISSPERLEFPPDILEPMDIDHKVRTLESGAGVGRLIILSGRTSTKRCNTSIGHTCTFYGRSCTIYRSVWPHNPRTSEVPHQEHSRAP